MAEKVKGIGGWLLFFIIVIFLSILGSFFQILGIITNFNSEIQSYQHLYSIIGPPAFTHGLIIIPMIAFFVLFIIMAINLIRKTPRAVPFALWVLGLDFLYWGLFFRKTDIGFILVAIIWAYFARSKRVKTTYGTN